MNRAAIALAACLVCSCGSKRRSADTAMIDKLTQFSEAMCQCKDKACADKVNGDMAKWGEQMAKEADKNAKPDPEMMKRVQPLMERYTACTMKAMSVYETAVDAGTPASLPAMPKPPLRADALVKAARDHAAKRDQNLVVSRLDILYARANGTLDAQHGQLLIEYRMRPVPLDDPKRPIGAPVPEPPPEQANARCPTWSVAAGAWSEQLGECKPERELVARCSVEQIWARAIKDQVPAAALASLSLDIGGDEQHTQFWHFSIVDKPRNIDIHKSYADDCPPVVEKP